MAIQEKVGFAIGHAIMRTVSVVCVLAVIGMLCWSVYVAFFKPHGSHRTPTKNMQQQAERIENKDIQETHYHGIFHFKLGGFEIGF